MIYATDVTPFVTKHGNFRVIRDAVQHYEKALGPHLNIHKSKVLAVGEWKGTVKTWVCNLSQHTDTGHQLQ